MGVKQIHLRKSRGDILVVHDGLMMMGVDLSLVVASVLVRVRLLAIEDDRLWVLVRAQVSIQLLLASFLKSIVRSFLVHNAFFILVSHLSLLERRLCSLPSVVVDTLTVNASALFYFFYTYHLSLSPSGRRLLSYFGDCLTFLKLQLRINKCAFILDSVRIVNWLVPSILVSGHPLEHDLVCSDPWFLALFH